MAEKKCSKHFSLFHCHYFRGEKTALGNCIQANFDNKFLFVHRIYTLNQVVESLWFSCDEKKEIFLVLAKYLSYTTGGEQEEMAKKKKKKNEEMKQK